jgi:predicted dithiol-disulfide oxidoreductase (DUF899 family)
VRHQIALHGEWLKARRELLAVEKEFTHQRDSVVRKRSLDFSSAIPARNNLIV